MLGWNNLKANVFVTAISLGIGSSAMAFARMASLGGRSATIAGALAALTTSAVSIAVVDFPK